ncbi:MAG: nucleotide exchange factor GrpE [Acidimicrobiia bacterium]|nr:nucleotide exchange factor GrpE [Acidimicrobiia bacterium]
MTTASGASRPSGVGGAQRGAPAGAEVDDDGPPEGAVPGDGPPEGGPAPGPTGGEPASGPGAHGGAPGAPTVNVEELVSLVENLTAERDANLDARARLQAEFENYRKRVAKQELDQTARAHESLVNKLLPTLDAFDAAMAHGVEGLQPLQQYLLGALQREGLARVDPVGAPFDPNEHEAVLHEEGGSDEAHGIVVEVLRPGYLWKGRVIRPAMVKVRT